MDDHKVAIVGSRDYPRLDLVRQFVRNLPENAIVVSGGARGVDKTAQNEAEKHGWTTEIFPADWSKHGRAAGYIRNQDIVDAADVVVAFWDGQSRGTYHTINLAYEAGKEVIVINAAGRRSSVEDAKVQPEEGTDGNGDDRRGSSGWLAALDAR